VWCVVVWYGCATWKRIDSFKFKDGPLVKDM
jgi:hypothetical protein